MNQPTELQKSLAELQNIIDDNYDSHQEGGWPSHYLSIAVSTILPIRDAAKRVEDLERENRMLKEQIRVGDAAFQHLFERTKDRQ